MGPTRWFVLSVSLALSISLLTTVVDGACMTRSLTINPSPGGNEKEGMGGKSHVDDVVFVQMVGYGWEQREA